MATERQWLDNKFIKQVQELLSGDGVTERDVAKKLDVSRGTVALARLRGDVPVKSREDFSDSPDDAIAARVVQLRNKEALSWGQISARIGVPESKVRSAYTTATGNDTKGLKLEGKGGRSPGESKPAAKKAAGATKKASVKAQPGSTLPKPLVEMDVDELSARIEGKVITVGRGGKTEKITVKTVKKLAKGEVTFADKDGKSRIVKTADIVKASR